MLTTKRGFPAPPGSSGSSFGNLITGGGFQGKGTQGTGYGVPGGIVGPPQPPKKKKKYCMKDILAAMKKVESGGKCDATDGGRKIADAFTFGAYQISKGYFDIAMSTFTEKCGIECTQYSWEHNGIPSVMCKNDKDSGRADEWSRCVVISYMWHYANRAGKGNIPGKGASPGSTNAPHNDSRWMDAVVKDPKTGLTDHAATAKNRKKMTDKDKKKNGKGHGAWSQGGEKHGGGKTKGAVDRLCECKGNEDDCELIARIHNGGSIAGNYGDPRGSDFNTRSLQRWDNTTNYWDKIQGELTPTGK